MFAALTKFVTKAESSKLVAQFKADGANDLAAIVETIVADLEAGKSPTLIGLDVIAKVKADAIAEYQKSLTLAPQSPLPPVTAFMDPAK